MSTLNRRSLIAGAASCAAVPAAAMVAPESVSAPVPPDLREVIAIYQNLNAERRDRMLGHFRDCLAAQRLFELDAVKREARS